MEDLNKQQLILLTLLVSFVTSIATGIITSTLLQEAPIAVTQTINRVVERTIEKVATVDGGNENNSGEVIKEVTNVVSEEDLILESIEKNTKSIARVKTVGFDGSEIVVSIGVIVSSDGIVTFGQDTYSVNQKYQIEYPDGSEYSVSKVFEDKESGFVFMKPGIPLTEKRIFVPAKLGDSDILRLGQTLIAVSGKESNAVTVGRVAELVKKADKLTAVDTDIRSSRAMTGSPVLNLSADLVGIEIEDSNSAAISYFPINALKNSINRAISDLNK